MTAGNETSKRLAMIGLYGVLIPMGLLTLIPFLWLLTASLKSGDTFFTGLFLPHSEDGSINWGGLTLSNFIRLFTEQGVGRAILNSLFLSSATAVLATLSCAAGGFALARYQFRGRAFLTGLVLVALIIPAPLLLAPGYQWIYRLGLLDTYTALILPAIAPAFGVFLFRQAARQSVPAELVEAARIDGCPEPAIFMVVGLPLLRPMVGAFLLITFLGTWNNFLTPQILLQSSERFPLAVAIAQLRGVYSTEYGLIMAGTLVSIAPVMILFLVLQREFIAGLTAGAVKG
ncbi:MAG: carbohydrate ABC transporter permease [Planctomycetota bacterium]